MFLKYLGEDQMILQVLRAVSNAYAAHNSFTFKIVYDVRIIDGSIDLEQEKSVYHTIFWNVTEVKSNPFW